MSRSWIASSRSQIPAFKSYELLHSYKSSSRIIRCSAAAGQSSLLHNKSARGWGEFSRGLFQMSRPINLVPSFLLSIGSSWMTANFNPLVFQSPAVWATSMCSSLIAAASVLVNDCFDHMNGTDELNGRNSLLQSGDIDTGDVGIAAGCMYGGVMIATCCLEQSSLRLLITLAAFLTFIYTPLLKKVVLLKNLAVASVIASSVLAGAMVVSEKLPHKTLVATLYLFFSIAGREILMDVKDMTGDESTGVNTIPVLFGEDAGVLAAVLSTVTATTLLAHILLMKSNLLMLLANVACALNLMLKSITYHRSQLSRIIDQESMLTLAFGLFTIATCS